jgi:hypothetical protein
MVSGPDSSNSAELHRMVAELKTQAQLFWDEWDKVDIEEFHHYTSIETALKILASKSLWASDVRSMNDTSEFQYAVSIVNEELIRRWNHLPIHLAEYFRPSSLLRLGRTWNAFAACFSTGNDLLEQWREYADEARGLSIGFKLERFSEMGRSSNRFALVKINYCSNDLRRAVNEICDVALRLTESDSLVSTETEIFWTEIALLLFNFALRFKNPSFRSEREWRTLSLEPSETPVWTRDQQGMIVKYIKVGFEANMVSRITLGPRASNDGKRRVQEFLKNSEFRDAQLCHSGVPLR